jgi:hypothetical protein
MFVQNLFKEPERVKTGNYLKYRILRRRKITFYTTENIYIYIHQVYLNTNRDYFHKNNKGFVILMAM